MGSQESLWGDEGHRDPDLSVDEDMVPDPPAFTGLFSSSLFKLLLHKVRSTTKLGAQTAPSEVSLDPADGLFQKPKTTQEDIPVPRPFLDVIQKQWDHTRAFPTSSSNDRHFYNDGPHLSELL